MRLAAKVPDPQGIGAHSVELVEVGRGGADTRLWLREQTSRRREFAGGEPPKVVESRGRIADSLVEGSVNVGIEQLVEPALEHLRGLFPRQCASCGATFATYYDFLCATAGGGSTCFDEFARLSRDEVVGTIGFAHCHCGSTLAVSSETAPVDAYRAFVAFLQVRAVAEKRSVAELLDRLMEMVRDREIADHQPRP